MSLDQESIDRSEVLIAPQEVHELLRRLTEYTIEAIPADEPRTLGGLAARTGIPIDKLDRTLATIRRKRPSLVLPITAIAAVAIVATVATHLPKPQVFPPPATQSQSPPTMDVAGLVSGDAVTYAPDGEGAQVDPTFEPSIPLKPGLSIYAKTNNVLWGTGDSHGAVIDRLLTSREEGELQKAAEELLTHAYNRAIKRRMQPYDPGSPRLPTAKEYPFDVGAVTYLGFARVQASIPIGGDPTTRAREIRRVAKDLVSHLRRNMRQTMDSDRFIYGR